MTIIQTKDHIHIGDIYIHKQMHQFITRDVLSMTGINADAFWTGFVEIFNQFTPLNKKLLRKRHALQKQLDFYHHQNPLTEAVDDAYLAQYQSYLESIGYIDSKPADGLITTTQVDDEIALLAGPQLVAPINNARFVINACNARWQSLYDALYRSDIIPQGEGFEITARYNTLRGEAVVRYAKQLLDGIFPLKIGHHHNVVRWFIQQEQLLAQLQSGEVTGLMLADALAGYQGTHANLASILLKHNGLHIEIKIDHESTVGQRDPAGIEDIIFESALTTIMDCEDSVAVVDVEDKIGVYRNWLALNCGTMTASIDNPKGGETRRMKSDRHYQTLGGQSLVLPGRSLMLVRNVGLHMVTDIVLDKNGEAMPEGILDAIVTSAIGLHDIQRRAPWQNSRTGSIYIVKPKLHGPEEVRFTERLLSSVEKLLKLGDNTLKLGLMDEERRTSLNLAACIAEAKHRIAFINTGFLDRTGDEIHSAMELGVFDVKNELKKYPWFECYELNNVLTALKSNFIGRAQIGKGMWPKPDHMSEMLVQKREHPESGASTAWVPSPIAATLHAYHYHQVSVAAVHRHMLTHEQSVNLQDMLRVPVVNPASLDEQTVYTELKNNAQSILGYVVRWIDQGIGCSKVPDVENVPLMEDRATLRISSQHIANWLHHRVCSVDQVKDVFLKMAEVVDEQNSRDPNYVLMMEDMDNNLALQAAFDLVFKGRAAHNGYIEEILHHYRKLKKSQAQNMVVSV